MGKSDCDRLLDRLEKLLSASSMPEIVAALIRLSRRYKAQLKLEQNSEFQGWQSWEDTLTVALKAAGGPEEFDELVSDA